MLRGHAGAVTSLSFGWDGKRLASGGEDATLKWWDVARSAKLARASMVTPGRVLDVACLRECEEAFVTTYGENEVQHWDLAEGKLMRGFAAHRQWPRVALSEDRRVALTIGCEGANPGAWDVATRKKRGALKVHASGLQAWQPSPDGSRLLTVGRDDAMLRGWDLVKLKPSWKVPGWKGGHALAWSPSGKRFATGAPRVAVHDARKGAPGVWASPDLAIASAIRWPRPGHRIFGCADRALFALAATDGRVFAEVRIRDGGVSALAASRDGKLVAVGTRNGPIHVFDAS